MSEIKTKKLKIKFSDFWYGFDQKNNFWTQVLDHIKISYEVVSGESDLLISSVFGKSHLHINDCRKKLIWIGENIRANNYYNHFDRVYGYDYDDNPKNFRLPLYLIDIWERDIDVFSEYRNKSKEEVREDYDRRKFCIFVYSNPNYPVRNLFYYRMNTIEKVDSYGKLFNNMGDVLAKDRQSKVEMGKNYKFSICFENGMYEGYITEKINDGFRSGGIPIYYGCSRIAEHFNEKSFINVNGLGVDNALDLIERMNKDFELYYEYYSQPIMNKESSLRDRFDYFLNNFTVFLKTI